MTWQQIMMGRGNDGAKMWMTDDVDEYDGCSSQMILIDDVDSSMMGRLQMLWA